MRSRVTEEFVQLFAALPQPVREHARRSYRIWKENPAHPGLQFGRIHAREPIYSVRICLRWRALGLLEGDTITWFWIGSHAEYDKLIQ